VRRINLIAVQSQKCRIFSPESSAPRRHRTPADRDFSLLPDRKQSSSCRRSARMNAWPLFFFGCPATSIWRLHLLQILWSADEALLLVLAIDRRETYRFLNSAIESPVTRKAFGVGLALSHSNSTNRWTDLVLGVPFWSDRPQYRN
jgi:hypothetical protein